MKYFLYPLFILLSSKLYGQLFFGGGFDVGIRSVGPKIELYMLNRIRIETGANITRFSTYSSHAGLKVSMFNVESSHNLWLGSNYKYKYHATSIFERNGIFYKYKTNGLNYYSPKISYSYKINSENNRKRNHFFLLEFTMQYDFLIGKKLIITPDANNIEISDQLENNMKKYFGGGVGIYASVIFFFGDKIK